MTNERNDVEMYRDTITRGVVIEMEDEKLRP